MEAAHVLFANFAGPIITLVSRKLHVWKAHKIEVASAGKTSKFRCITAEDAKVRTHKFREFLTLIL